MSKMGLSQKVILFWDSPILSVTSTQYHLHSRLQIHNKPHQDDHESPNLLHLNPEQFLSAYLEIDEIIHYHFQLLFFEVHWIHYF